jgi:hypothetical protein
MVLTTLYRRLLTRLMAAFIVVLVVSPYSEPFATIRGTDMGGAGAVDVAGASKGKTATQDVLATPILVFVSMDVFVAVDRPIGPSMFAGSHRGQRTILRL